MFKQVRSRSALLVTTGFMLATVLLLPGCGSDSPAANEATPEFPDTVLATDQPTRLPEPEVLTESPETPTSVVVVTKSPDSTQLPNAPTAESSVPPPASTGTATPPPQVSVVPEPVPEDPTPLPTTEVASDQSTLRPFIEVGQTIGHPLRTGGFLTGWEHYVYFQNDGLAGQVNITAEIIDLTRPTETVADPLTKSFEIDANEKYVATVRFSVVEGDASVGVLNTAQRTCNLAPPAFCTCGRSNLSVRVQSDPPGLSSGGSALSGTCQMSATLRDITVTIAPEEVPTPTPVSGLGMLEPISTFATLEMALDDSKPEPNGIVFGPDGDVYVSVGGTDQLLIFDSSGTLKTTIGTGVGSRDEGDLRAPAGVAVDKDGNVYVVETRNNRFQAFTESGDLLFSKGESGIGQGEFSFPNAIAISNEQEIYIVDAGRNRIQVFDIAGNFLRMWGSEGDANGEFRNPAGIAVADDGLVYIADSDNHRIQVFKSDGTYTTGWPVMVGEQTGAEPHAIVIDPRGIVYALADMRVIENYIVVSDMSGNYLDSWTVTYQGLAGIAITPDLGALFVTYSQWGRIEVFAIDQTKIP